MSNLDGADSSIQLAGERARLLQISNKNLVLLVQRDEAALLGPEVVALTGQEISGGDLVGGGIGSAERGTVDREFDCSGRVVLELDFPGNLNERGDSLAIELGNLGDDTLEAFPEITPGEGEIDDGVPEGHGGENITECDISSVDRGAESTSVGDSGVGV